MSFAMTVVVLIVVHVGIRLLPLLLHVLKKGLANPVADQSHASH